MGWIVVELTIQSSNLVILANSIRGKIFPAGAVKGLGELETERFIYLVKREHFDCTEWQRTLWDGMPVDEVYRLAADHENAKGNDGK